MTPDESDRAFVVGWALPVVATGAAAILAVAGDLSLYEAIAIEVLGLGACFGVTALVVVPRANARLHPRYPLGVLSASFLLIGAGLALHAFEAVPATIAVGLVLVTAGIATISGAYRRRWRVQT